MDFNPKHHLLRAKNLDAIKQLHQAGICHAVIAQFFSSEGVQLKQQDVTSFINSLDALSQNLVSDKKVQALIDVKRMAQQDDSLPCALN